VGLAIGFLIGLWWADETVDFIQTPLEKALAAYLREQMEEQLVELQEQGRLPPGDPERFKDLVFKDDLLAKEAYVDPVELLSEWQKAGAKTPTETAEALEIAAEERQPPHADGSGPEDGPAAGESSDDKEMRKIRKTDLVRVFLWRPIEDEIRVTSLSAHEPFSIFIRAALVVGAILASPWVFYQIWSFVAAGMYPHEKKYVHVFLPFSLGLFLLGASLAFFFVFEPVLKFLFIFNASMGIEQDIRISEWLSFVLILPLGFGISFQLPLVMLFLERIGIFDVRAYLSKWRVAVLVICILGMMLTPADPYSMLLMAIPLTFLYFGGILLCMWMPKARSPYSDD
jgi:sec-independent protein translocase protein TatC